MKMTRVGSGAIMAMCLIGSVHAGTTRFDFTGVTGTSRVNSYMTGLYGSAVNATGENLLTSGWSGRGNYIAGNSGSHMQITFADAIDSVSGVGRTSNYSGTMTVNAYDSTNHVVDSWSYNCSASDTLLNKTFSQAVCKLDFTCGRNFWLDDLCVGKHDGCRPVPVPGALVLGAFGTILVGWLRQGIGRSRKA
jgi:hypothetical protein